MSLFIKICGLRSSSDVDAATNAGADALGFVFARSPRQVTPEEAARATAACEKDTIKVAVMRHPSNDDWQRVLDEFNPDVLQTDAEDFAALEIPNNVRRWPVLREGVHDYADFSLETFLYEGKDSGKGETVDWQRAAAVSQQGNMILAGGLTCDNVARAVATARPYGVDVSSAVESAPGRKDADRIRQFIQAARAAERSL